MSIRQHMRRRRGEVLELYKKNEVIMSIFANRSPICDEIGSSIKLTKILGKGQYSEVWEADNQGEYIAVKIPFKPLEIIEEKIEKRETIEEYAEHNERLNGINKSVIINMNGRDPKRIIKSGDIILLPKYAKNCLTTKIERFDYNTSNPSPKILTLPKGSYLCDDESFSEYLIGLLFADLYTKGVNGIISINFIDVLDLSSCPSGNSPFPKGTERKWWDKQYDDENNLLYIFQQKIEGELLNCPNPYFPNNNMPHISSVILQLFHAIECYQRAYQISHNDLNTSNIVYAKTPDTWNGQDIRSADYFQYVIDDTSFYIPASDYILKIIDFGISAKYSSPMISDRLVIKGEYTTIPNFYSPAYDVGLLLTTIFAYISDNYTFSGLSEHWKESHNFLSLCIHYYIGEFRSKEFQILLSESNNNLFTPEIAKWLDSRQLYSGDYGFDYANNPILPNFFDKEYKRPLIDKLDEFPLNIMTAAIILKSDIFKENRKRPEGKIVRVGFC